MPRVLITCPRTGGPVYTGLNFDWFAFESTEIDTEPVSCPQCGGIHPWTKNEAYLEADGGGD